MSDTGNPRLLAEQTVPPRSRKIRVGSGFSHGRSPFLLAGALVGGAALGAGGLALAATPAAWNHGPRLERVQSFVLRALDSVGATTVQEAKIHDIIAVNLADVERDRSDHDALRTQVLGLLRAPTIDRAAIERLRAERIAKLDAKSKAMVQAVLDAADQLTPEQRGKLADRAAAMAQRGPMGRGWHGGPMDDPRRNPAEGGRGPGSQDYRPDDGPDKG